MDPDVIKLFGVMLAIMLPVALGGGVFVLVSSFTKRSARRRAAPDAAGLERLEERLEDLERRESRVQEIEERLDFVERVLAGLREGRPALESPRAPREQTPR